MHLSPVNIVTLQVLEDGVLIVDRGGYVPLRHHVESPLTEGYRGFFPGGKVAES
jgi:hypothetical protein